MKTKIENIDDLRSEIIYLELQCAQQEEVLACHAKMAIEQLHTPIMLFNKLHSWFGGGTTDKKEEHDWVNNTLHAILPLVLDKVFFRKSGFMVKTLAALIAQNMATLITKDTVVDGVNYVAEWIKSIKVKNAENRTPDFGIPPDSETY
ncbi:MAG: hypothetical protein U0X71_03675 [Sphingobacteriaceae bacterium]